MRDSENEDKDFRETYLGADPESKQMNKDWCPSNTSISGHHSKKTEN
jgi:hypothetical protein